MKIIRNKPRVNWHMAQVANSLPVTEAGYVFPAQRQTYRSLSGKTLMTRTYKQWIRRALQRGALLEAATQR